MNKKSLFLILLCFFSMLLAIAQDSREAKEFLLSKLSKENPVLNEKTRIDVSGLSLYDFLNAVAVEHKINISADSDLDTTVQSSFFDIPVKDVFLFAADKYELDIEVVNDIIVFKKQITKEELPEPEVKKIIDISYNRRNKFLTTKLSNDNIFEVTKKITDLADVSFVIDPEIKDLKVSAYIVNRPIEQVIPMIGKSNGLTISLNEQGFYFVKKAVKDPEESTISTNSKNSRRKGAGYSKQALARKSSDANISLSNKGFLTVDAYDSNATSIILDAADRLKINYVLYDRPDDLASTFSAAEITYDELLTQLFVGSDYTFKRIGDVYFIGLQTSTGLRSRKLIQLENRTIETVLETLPAALIDGIEVKEFIELNGIMVSGAQPRINELEDYIRQIDKVVPMILIEVIIAQYQKSNDIQTGIKAGLSDDLRARTSGTLFPDANLSVAPSSINRLIDAFNGLGIFNLGKVTERFYLDLKFLENNSVINLQSTPKISTLNGHEATLSIGQTDYYFEQSNRLINSGLGNDVFQSGQWKSTEANLSLNILPFVSKDEQVTLTITVEKSAFLARQGENAPPGKATQQFQSLVRCKNGEMILLGGLDELENENSGTGTPFLSRIPVIKWLFSGRSKSKKKAKLHLFIKPTIVY